MVNSHLITMGTCHKKGKHSVLTIKLNKKKLMNLELTENFGHLFLKLFLIYLKIYKLKTNLNIFNYKQLFS